MRVGRLFFAIWPEIQLADELNALGRQQRQQAGGRQMRADTLHMTLAFLGDQPLERLPDLCVAAGRVHAECFDLRLDRVAGWRANRLCYAAPSFVPPALLLLAKQLRECLGAAGFTFDGKAFKPHVTLLRNLQAIPEEQVIQPIDWTAKEFLLMQSLPASEGTRYKVLGRWSLAGSEAGLIRS